MHKTAGQLASKENNDTERREDARQRNRKPQPADIHPSLRALPDYPE